jgi:hypothetical protein
MRRSWNRVGMWETRIYQEFLAWTSPDNNYKIVRDATASLLSLQSMANPMDHSSASSSHSSASGQFDNVKPVCVAFLGNDLFHGLQISY